MDYGPWTKFVLTMDHRPWNKKTAVWGLSTVDYRNTLINMTSNSGSTWILESGTADWPPSRRR